MVNWGIVGPGNIANKFAQDLVLSSQANCYAVASYTQNKSQEFAAKYGFAHYYRDYKSLFQDENVDVVYIATPHVFHYKNALEAVKYKKAVLCEKPMAINRRQVLEVLRMAQQNKVFFMEALWSRFLPSYIRLKEIVDSAEIGDVQFVEAEFGFLGSDIKGRLFDRNLGGGALLDIGIYTVFLAEFLLGNNHQISSRATIHEGIDLETFVEFQYPQAKCFLHSTFVKNCENTATIEGTKGKITLSGNFHMTTQLKIESMSSERTETLPFVGNGYFHEIEAVNTAIQNNDKEALMTHADSLNLIQTLDEIRSQIGLVYEGD